MSKNIIKISRPAQSDLRDILNYTLANWGEEQFKIYSERLNSAFIIIIDNPKIGKKYDSFHIYPIEQHLVFYKINNNEISIIRVLHKRMNIRDYL